MHDEVVGLGAWCDVVPASESTASPGSVCFAVSEFAVLGDGRTITLHQGERGFAVSGPLPTRGGAPARTRSWWSWRRPSDQLRGLTAEEIESSVLATVLPDEDDGEEHPWEWLAGLLRLRGVVVSAESLRSVPYTVEFSERLQRLLTARPPGSGR